MGLNSVTSLLTVPELDEGCDLIDHLELPQRKRHQCALEEGATQELVLIPLHLADLASYGTGC